jgi:hypothetical protein
VSSFHEAADGVLHLDSSDLTFEETVEAVLDVVLETVEGTTPGKAASSGSVVADLVAAARVDGEPDTLTVDLEGTLTGAGGRSGTAS